VSTEKTTTVISRAELLATALAGLPAAAITIKARVADEAEALSWVEALGLTDVALRGQPHPLQASVPDFWIATIDARSPGARVEIVWDEPHTPAREAEWIAADGPRHHPRVPGPADEPAGGGSDV